MILKQEIIQIFLKASILTITITWKYPLKKYLMIFQRLWKNMILEINMNYIIC